jgi:hypothetical protein
MTMTTRIPSLRGALTGLLALLVVCTPAHAEWFGDLSLATERIERGQPVSEGQPSLGATLGWRHAPSGVYASLGVATVSDDRFVGSDGVQLMPTVGWSLDAKPWRAAVWLAHTAYPGANGPWFGELPPALQSLNLSPRNTDYATTEIGASIGWQALTVTWMRALSDYQGLAFAGPGGRVSFESKGTTYVGLDLTVPFAERWMVQAGAGRLTVPDADELAYTDWRLGLALDAAGLRWGLRVSGSDASVQWRSREARSSNSTKATAHVTWSF